MRRLLQIALFLLTAAALLTPISEALDRWDAPGLANDTEMRLFALALVLALVLLTARLIAVSFHAASVARPWCGLLWRDAGGRRAGLSDILPFANAASSPPLRI